MNHAVGKMGEETALQYLISQGYCLVFQNYRCRLGEIDLIIQKEKTLVFVEVKTRKNARYGLPREAVTISKQRAIIKTAMQYIQRYRVTGLLFRFDVVEVYQDIDPPKVVHLPNAFTLM